MIASSSANCDDSWGDLDRVAQSAGDSICKTLLLSFPDDAHFGSLKNGLKGCAFVWGEPNKPAALMELDEHGDFYVRFDLIHEKLSTAIINRKINAWNVEQTELGVTFDFYVGAFDWKLSANCTNNIRRCDNAKIAVNGSF